MRSRTATRLAIDLAALAAMAALYLAAPRAHAQGAPPACGPTKTAHDMVDDKAGGRWIELTDLQRAFLAGVFILAPDTPMGLPFGDKAVVARRSAATGYVVFFVDGDQVCEPMKIPQTVYDLLGSIGAGTVTHLGTEN